MKGLLFTYGLCYGGAVVSLFNPFVGLLVYVCFAIVKPELMWFWSVPQGNYSRIVAVALLVGWVFQGFGRWQFGQARGIVIAFTVYWVWAAIGISWATDRDAAWRWVEIIGKVLLPFLVGMTIIDSVQKLKMLAWVIMLSQGYVALEANLSYFSGYNRLWEEGFVGLDNNSVAIALDTCIGLAFFLGLQTKNLWLKGVAFAMAALMAHAILFSFSRGGMVALCITGIVSFVLLPKKLPHYLIFAVAALLVLRLAGPQVVERFATSFAKEGARDDSAESRLQLWGACWDLMKKHPLGIGPDQFGFVAKDYGWKEGKLAHTLWLQLGAELGFLGLGCIMLFYGICAVRLLPLAWESRAAPDPWLHVAARMVIAALVGFAVSAQFVSLTTLEIPFYVTLIGAITLKLCSVPPAASPDALGNQGTA
jgi:probable O-glycosylation ligase (exosortase A-associated)